MAKSHDNHDEAIILDRTDDPVVSNAVLPVPAQLRTTERLAKAPWILTSRDAVAQEEKQSLSYGTSDLA